MVGCNSACRANAAAAVRLQHALPGRCSGLESHVHNAGLSLDTCRMPRSRSRFPVTGTLMWLVHKAVWILRP